MPKVVELNIDTLIHLKETKGHSYERIAASFNVCRKTVKNKFEEAKRNERSEQITEYAAKLLKMVDEAPDGLCRKELLRAVNFIRTRHNISPEKRKRQIMESIQTGGRTLEDIAEDCGLDSSELKVFRDDLIKLLDELIAEKRIEKVARGGVLNRGRKTKYHYLPVAA